MPRTETLDGTETFVVHAAVEIANVALRKGEYHSLTRSDLRAIDEWLGEVAVDGYESVRGRAIADVERDLDQLRSWLTSIARAQRIERSQYTELRDIVAGLQLSPQLIFTSSSPTDRSKTALGTVEPTVSWRIANLRSLTAVAVMDLLNPSRRLSDRLYNCQNIKCRRFGLDMRSDSQRGSSRFFVNCPPTKEKVDGSADHGNAANQQRVQGLGHLQSKPAPRASNEE